MAGLLVDVEEIERRDAVPVGGSRVHARRLKASVAEQVGDDDEVGAAAYEAGGEGVTQDVALVAARSVAWSRRSLRRGIPVAVRETQRNGHASI